MLSVRTLSQEFCTRAFTFYMLTKDETTNFVTDALFVLVRPMLHAATIITQLKIVFVIAAVNQTRRTLLSSLHLRLYLNQIKSS
jgi:hypothetical protein